MQKEQHGARKKVLFLYGVFAADTTMLLTNKSKANLLHQLSL